MWFTCFGITLTLLLDLSFRILVRVTVPPMTTTVVYMNTSNEQQATTLKCCLHGNPFIIVTKWNNILEGIRKFPCFTIISLVILILSISHQLTILLWKGYNEKDTSSTTVWSSQLHKQQQFHFYIYFNSIQFNTFGVLVCSIGMLLVLNSVRAPKALLFSFFFFFNKISITKCQNK